MQALVSTQSSLCSPPSPHLISHYLSTSLSISPSLEYIGFADFFPQVCCFNAYLFRKHMLSVFHNSQPLSHPLLLLFALLSQRMLTPAVLLF